MMVVHNAAMNAKHPDCPQAVVEAIVLRIAAMREPSNDDTSPKVSFAKAAGPDSKA